MKHLYAPWRSVYFDKKRDGCPFCLAELASEDEERGVLFRAKECFGIMNLYPYNPGAFMVIPYIHTNRLDELSDECWEEMSGFVKLGVFIVKKYLKADGVNIGMNIGEAAGAGIAEHIHYHIVPRWYKDTNFITTIAETRVAGTSFEKIYLKLKDGFDEEILRKNKEN